MNFAFAGSFFMQKFKHKEVSLMFSDEILEKIFSDKEMRIVPLGYQSIVVSVVERVINEMGVDLSAVSES